MNFGEALDRLAIAIVTRVSDGPGFEGTQALASRAKTEQLARLIPVVYPSNAQALVARYASPAR